jgi:hypothetical protein
MSMTTENESNLFEHAAYEPESPFAESVPVAGATQGEQSFTPWTESFSPFAEGTTAGVITSEEELLVAEAFESLRDEQFDEALAELVNETSEAVDQRLAGEGPTGMVVERLRLGEAHLAPIAFEAEQYLDRLSADIAHLDIASLSPDQLDELFERLEPANAGLTFAGEEFVGGLIRKAKNVVKNVVKTAGKVVRKVASIASPLLGPVLSKLKALVKPLLKRVLDMAINRLPAPLHAPARMLAAKLGIGEAESEFEFEFEGYATTTPVAVGNPEALGESLDAALAEAIVHRESLAEQGETFGYELEDEGITGTQLETLGEARAQLIDRLQAAADGDDMAPAIEQFIPAILPALRLGIGLVGRPKVVGFLGKFLAGLIGKWVGPKLAGPLSNAIVDTGLRLITLESPEVEDEQPQQQAPAVLAATIEDTVRRLAEHEEYVFEDEDLLQLALAESFEQAVATNFPSNLVRSAIQPAPTLGGSFVPRHPRRTYAYKKYSRTPEIEITEQLAKSIRTFGGPTLAASLTAVGIRLPFRARVHVFEATLGTTLPRIARLERGVAGLGTNRREAWGLFHPLTPTTAGMLLREPGLGSKVSGAFLRSRHRLAAGQRVFYLEPASGAMPAGVPAAIAPPAPALGGRAARARTRSTTPSGGGVTIDLVRSEIRVGLFFSEADAQSVAQSVRAGRGTAALLKALSSAYDGVSAALGAPGAGVRIIKEQTEGEELVGSIVGQLAPSVLGLLKRKVREWVMTALTSWVRARGQEFVGAAEDPRQGVTVQVTLRNVPELALVRQGLNGQLQSSVLATAAAKLRGTPAVTVAVVAGRQVP